MRTPSLCRRGTCQPSVRSGPWPGGGCPGDAQTSCRAGGQRVHWGCLAQQLAALAHPHPVEEPEGGQQIPWTLVLTPLLCDKHFSLAFSFSMFKLKSSLLNP